MARKIEICVCGNSLSFRFVQIMINEELMGGNFYILKKPHPIRTTETCMEPFSGRVDRFKLIQIIISGDGWSHYGG